MSGYFNPTDADGQQRLASLLISHGRIADAISCYRQALRLDPNNVQAHNNLGNALRSQGQMAEAIGSYQEALRLDPSNADLHFNLGAAFHQQGLATDAAHCYRQAILVNADHAHAYTNLGAILAAQGNLGEASVCYMQALRVDPSNADVLNQLGLANMAQARAIEAISCFEQALQQRPDHADATRNLGFALMEQGRDADAVPFLRHALSMNLSDVDVLYSLGLAVRRDDVDDEQAYREAAQLHQRALTLSPDRPDIHYNLSLSLTRLGLYRDALRHVEAVLRVHPDHGPTLWHRSFLKLVQGDWERGWQDYGHRWTLPEATQRSFDAPCWDGSALAGKIILVYAEQGLGDTIQFARYLPLVAERGGAVLFECQPALARLCAGIPGVRQIISAGADLPPFDVQAPLLDLPRIFGATPANVPVSVPYLHEDPSRRAHWRDELTGLTGFKVGIVWRGSRMNRTNPQRSIPLQCFERLAHLEGVVLVSLQVEHGTEEKRAYADELSACPFPIIDLGSRFDATSMEDVAAVLPNLDLLVTIDSGVAHLAGALGVPVWTLLRKSADWRWLVDREDSPFYPTMRLFRQAVAGDWEEVVRRVARELGEVVRVSAQFQSAQSSTFRRA